jgi:hypothetical protein
LKQKIISDLTGFVMDTHNFMIEAYNDKIVQLFESGIIEIIWKMMHKNYPIDDDRKALSLDQLHMWFILWGGLLLIAVASFIIEILVWKLQKLC